MSNHTEKRFRCGKCGWRFESPMSNCPNLHCNNEQFGDYVCGHCGTEQSGYMFMSNWSCWKCQHPMPNTVISLSDGAPYNGPKPYPKKVPRQRPLTEREIGQTKEIKYQDVHKGMEVEKEYKKKSKSIRKPTNIGENDWVRKGNIVMIIISIIFIIIFIILMII